VLGTLKLCSSHLLSRRFQPCAIVSSRLQNVCVSVISVHHSQVSQMRRVERSFRCLTALSCAASSSIQASHSRRVKNRGSSPRPNKCAPHAAHILFVRSAALQSESTGLAQQVPNPALNLAPFGRWTLRDEAAQRRLALR
jgi:hypothetical protein